MMVSLVRCRYEESVSMLYDQIPPDDSMHFSVLAGVKGAELNRNEAILDVQC